ncbi:PspC domain-containing protein [Pseudoalteromonas sp. KS88]|uniref:PspC domain-containing protein n=1 Tax=Pseudoalteromonas sp. KS88 TaxID=2109918 RepID=UPI001082188D|nr:PspC domain-containing protein [Pseudoalteromonas sp. KS88]TGE85277.1 PspC domain-containing protein [Pseudoalteromonas sp. KS88]
MQDLSKVKLLTRGESGVLGGVCSGLAEHYNLRKNGLRLAFIFSSLFLVIPVLLYIVLWLILPCYPSTQAMARHLRRKALHYKNSAD